MNRLPFILVTLIILPFIFGCHQEIEPEVFFNEDEFTISSVGGEFSVPFTSNVPLTVSISEDWVTEITSKNTSGAFYFKVDFNPEYDSRSCSIMFSHSESGFSKTVNLLQEQQDAIIPSSLEYEVFYEDQDFSIPISSNVDITVSISGGDWVKLIESKALTSKSLLFHFEENSGKEPREAIVSISSGSLLQSVKLRQLATTHRPITEDDIKESIIIAEEKAQEAYSILKTAREKTGESSVDAEAVAAEIRSLDGIITAKVNPLRSTITYMQRDSLHVTLMLNNEVVQTNKEDQKTFTQVVLPVKAKSPKVSLQSSNSNKYVNGKKALILAPFQHDFDDPLTEYKLFLTQMGYSVEVYEEDKAGIDKFNGEYLKGFDIVIISSHGGHRFIETSQVNYGFVVTGTKAKTNSSDWETFKDAFNNLSNPYYGVIQDGFIVADEGELYLAMSSLNLGSAHFDNHFIYLSACGQAMDLSSNGNLMKAFSDRGAGAVAGFDNSAYDQEGTYVTYGWLVYMGLGSSMSKAIECMNSSAPDLIKHLHILPERVEDRFYLFDATPYNLKSVAELNTASLSWEMNPSIAGLSFEGGIEYKMYFDVFVDGSFVGSTESQSYQINDLTAGDHSWHIVSNSVINGDIFESFISKSHSLTITQVGEPIIEIPEHIDDGYCVVGQTKTLSVDVKNTGNADLIISNVTTYGDFQSSFNWTNATIAPGDSKKLEVHYSVNETGPHRFAVYFISNAQKGSGGNQHYNFFGFDSYGQHDSPSYSSEMVDLGLSVKWASCDLGSTSPFDYGEHYAWGETDRKSRYDWSNYRWCNGSESSLTKYTDNDGRITLVSSDDAATSHLGGKWRIPTKEECQELIDNCNWRATIKNCVPVFEVTSKTNGNSIYFMRWPNTVGRLSEYWASSLWGGSYAYSLMLNWYGESEVCDPSINGYERRRGALIRPVYGDRPDIEPEYPDDPDDTGSPIIEFSEESFDFGSVSVGSDSGKILYISNTGDSDLHVTALRLVDGNKGFYLGNSTQEQFTLSPGSRRSVLVFFRPKVKGEAQDQILVKSNASNKSYTLLYLKGVAK